MNKKSSKKTVTSERYLKLLPDGDNRLKGKKQVASQKMTTKHKAPYGIKATQRAESVTNTKVQALRNQQKTYNLRQIGARRAKKIILLVGILSIFGVVMIFAASAVTSTIAGKSPFSLALRQVMWVFCGGIGCLVASKMSLQKIRDLAKPLLLIAGVLLVVVLVPGISKSSGGASRWIGIGPFEVQPSELAKLAFAIFAADLITKRENSKRYVKHLVAPLAIVAVMLGILIMRQPDLGTTMIVVGVGLVELGVSRLPKKIFLVTLAVSAALVALLSVIEPYRFNRLLAFLNPSANAKGSAYQLIQSQLALGQGHIAGVGFATSPMAWGLLPNAQTDFIFSVIGNDMGVVGTLAVLAAFTALFVLGIKTALAARDVFLSYLGIGLVVLICGQAFLNMAGVIGILPETGVPLPFFSSGGSSLIVMLTACGVLVNISRHPLTVTSPKKSRFGAGGGRYTYLVHEKRLVKKTEIAAYIGENERKSRVSQNRVQANKPASSPYSVKDFEGKYRS
ncbi:MAG: putative lipid II flippase FtsW [Firmicutes bacterium]|nr:putative lipid II flippase FtsW [Bacillota bacterium]